MAITHKNNTVTAHDTHNNDCLLCPLYDLCPDNPHLTAPYHCLAGCLYTMIKKEAATEREAHGGEKEECIQKAKKALFLSFSKTAYNLINQGWATDEIAKKPAFCNKVLALWEPYA